MLPEKDLLPDINPMEFTQRLFTEVASGNSDPVSIDQDAPFNLLDEEGLKTITASNEFLLGANPPNPEVVGRFKQRVLENQRYIKDVAPYSVEAMLTEKRYDSMISKKLPEELRDNVIKLMPTEVPNWKKEAFLDDINTAINPSYLMSKVKNGLITAENVADFAEMNPYLYSQMVVDLISKWKNGNLMDKLSYSQKLALELFLQTEDITGLRGGMFNVNEEPTEPIQSIEKQIYAPNQHVKGNLDHQSRKNKISTTQRLESL